MKKIISVSNLLYLRSENGIALLILILFLTLEALAVLLRFEFSSERDAMHLFDNLYLLTPPNWYIFKECHPWVYPLLIAVAIAILLSCSLLIYFSQRLITRSKKNIGYWQYVEFNDGDIIALIDKYAFNWRSLLFGKQYFIGHSMFDEEEESMVFISNIYKGNLKITIKLKLLFENFNYYNFYKIIKEKNIGSDADCFYDGNKFDTSGYMKQWIQTNIGNALPSFSNEIELKNELDKIVIPENILGSKCAKIEVFMIQPI